MADGGIYVNSGRQMVSNATLEVNNGTPVKEVYVNGSAAANRVWPARNVLNQDYVLADWSRTYTFPGGKATPGDIDSGFDPYGPNTALVVGDWDTTLDWDDTTALIGFKSAVDSGIAWYTSFISALGAQMPPEGPVITSATLRLSAGNDFADAIGFYLGTFTAGTGENSSWPHTHTNIRYGNTKYTQNQYTVKEHVITDTEILDGLVSRKGLILHATDGGKNTWRGYFGGTDAPSTNDRPQLKLSMDWQRY